MKKVSLQLQQYIMSMFRQAFIGNLKKKAAKGDIAAIIMMSAISKDYIPGKNSSFDEWQTNFITEATALLSTWGISPTDDDWVAVTDNEAIWNAAWAAANPFLANRTHPLVVDMRTARKNYVKALRYFVQAHLAIQKNVTDGQRATVGITVREASRTYHPVPTDRAPKGEIFRTGNLFHELRITDPATPDSKRKPVGADLNVVYMAVVDQNVLPAESDFLPVGSSSTYKFIASFSLGQRGKMAYYFVKWQDSHQKEGVPSDIFSKTIS